MASVVFIRAANVGGHQVFQPAALARKLSHLGVVNLGAAGTFVIREKLAASKLRGEILHHLPFRPEMLICPGHEVAALAAGDWYANQPAAGGGIHHYVTILFKNASQSPELPLAFPNEDKWEIRLLAQSGRFVLSVHRPGPKKVYPNALVEKLFAVPATTRNWNTILSLAKLLGVN